MNLRQAVSNPPPPSMDFGYTRWMRRSSVLLALCLLPWLAFAVLWGIEAPAGVCSWSCHDQGCPHTPLLPLWLTGDDGAFGQVMAGLWWLGSYLHEGKMAGYMLANLLIFVFLFPLSWLLLGIAHLRVKR